MHSRFGDQVRFRIVKHVGYKDALDSFWAFAQVEVLRDKSTKNELCLASFGIGEYRAITDPKAELVGIMTHQVFDNRMDIHSAMTPDARSVLNLHIHPSLLSGQHPASEDVWSRHGKPLAPKRRLGFLRRLAAAL